VHKKGIGEEVGAILWSKEEEALWQAYMVAAVTGELASQSIEAGIVSNINDSKTAFAARCAGLADVALAEHRKRFPVASNGEHVSCPVCGRRMQPSAGDPRCYEAADVEIRYEAPRGCSCHPTPEQADVPCPVCGRLPLLGQRESAQEPFMFSLKGER
jgi:hypothetical protein